MDDSQRRFCSNIVANIIIERGIAIVNIPEAATVAAQALKACELEYHKEDLTIINEYKRQVKRLIKMEDGHGMHELYQEIDENTLSKLFYMLNNYEKGKFKALQYEGWEQEKEGE